MKKFLVFSLLILLGFSFNVPTKVYAGRGGSAIGGALAGSMFGGLITAAAIRPRSSSDAGGWRSYSVGLEREVRDLRDELRRLRNDIDYLREQLRKSRDENDKLRENKGLKAGT